MISSKKDIILGLAQLDYKYGLNNEKRRLNDLKHKLEKFNITNFDTAYSYKNSDKFIRNLDCKKTIYSKLPVFEKYEGNLQDKTKKIVEDICISNSVDHLEAIYLHDPVLPLEKCWPLIYMALKKLKKKGIIKNIGVSVYTIAEIERILKVFTPDLIQFPINIFNQQFYNLELFKALKKKKIKLIARSVFLQGLLVKKQKKNSYFEPWQHELNSWFKYLKKNHLNASHECLKFVLSDKNIDKIIIGVDNVNQLDKNVNSIKKILKNNNNKNEFSDFYINDQNLTDPRYWFRKNIKTNLIKWSSYKKNILGGSMLLSKKPDRYLPGVWPVYYKKAKGCYIWAHKKKYIDFCLMGVGTNILGYSNKNIDNEVIKEIKKSNMSTFNSDKFNDLSLEFFKMHKWSNKCFYAKTGAEANAVALRIARSYSKKNSIIACGYHGWQDWYLSANIKNKNSLNKIHLSGISTVGVPKQYSELVHTVFFNDYQSIKRLVENDKSIGAIIMEVYRNIEPKKNFLKKIRNLCTRKKITLIFDECTSGFRACYGGIHKIYGVNPDIAVFGKALGNGIPINAILSSNKICKDAEKSFISSTFWSDSLGPASALATLSLMKKNKTWKKIQNIGKKIKSFWLKMSKKYNIKIEVYGIDSMPIFKFLSKKNEYYINFITQEMFKKSILANNIVYCCTYHEKELNKYSYEFEKIFKKISEFEKYQNITPFIENPMSEKNFTRLN